ADRGARRRPDRAGARAGQAARGAGPGRDPHLAQTARHLPGRGLDHRPAARPERRRVQAHGDDAAAGRRGDHRGPVVQGPGPGGPRMSMVTEPPLEAEGPARDTVAAYARRWWTDVKAGELGSLPIIVGLIVICIVFQTQNDRFL